LSSYLFGLLFGLATTLSVGVLSLVVMNQGLAAGYPRVLFGIVTASLCDTLLIVLSAVGASTALTAPGSRKILICLGVVFLLLMGVRTLRSSPQYGEIRGIARPTAMIVQAAGASLLNPHAILETVGILGAAIAAQGAGSRTEFAAGVVSASWVWFLAVGLGATMLQSWLTGTTRLWIQRVPGVMMLSLAGLLALELT
jgi:L-lysine exporter family protein LysE/ArgO